VVNTLTDPSTLWCWLHAEAIRPWQHCCWLFPRDSDFAHKAGRILDLYQRQWQAQPLQEDECVLSTDEEASIQARRRLHPTIPPTPGRPMKCNMNASAGGPALICGLGCASRQSVRSL